MEKSILDGVEVLVPQHEDAAVCELEVYVDDLLVLEFRLDDERPYSIYLSKKQTSTLIGYLKTHKKLIIDRPEA